jgi:hypothetical protein
LIDDLKAAKGFRQVLWNSPADANTASWLQKIIYIETDDAVIIQLSEAKEDEDEEHETETMETVEVTKASYCVQLTKKLYGHKLRDLGINKIKLWQKIDNVKSLIEARVTL